VALNQPSLVRFQNQLQSGGLFFINSSITEAKTTRGDIELIEVPASEMAEKMGNPKGVNTVMLGAFIKKSNLVSLDSLLKGLEDSFKKKPKLIDINKKALKEGYDLF